MTDLLETAWMPLLVYVQELYSYPIRFDLLPTENYMPDISSGDIIFKGKNFAYDRPQQYDCLSSRVFQSLTTISSVGSDIKGGHTTTVTVHIPKDPNHPFWQLDAIQHGEKLFDCHESKDTISFQVTRWGPQEKMSYYNVTLRAKDIIATIRAAVSNPSHLSKYVSVAIDQSLRISNRLPDNCPVLRLGMKLNYLWRRGKFSFSPGCTSESLDLAMGFIQDIIDKTKLSDVVLIFKYYQVYRFD
jgi:hypothetical protein